MTFFLMVGTSLTDSTMSRWDYILDPWIGDELEMSVYSLRKARKHLGGGCRLFVRTSLRGVTRYAVVEQGLGEHDRTTPVGAVMSVSADLSTILPGELHLDPFASSLDFHKRMFISRTCVFRDVSPTVLAFQFPPSFHLPEGDASQVSEIPQQDSPLVSSQVFVSSPSGANAHPSALPVDSVPSALNVPSPFTLFYWPGVILPPFHWMVNLAQTHILNRNWYDTLYDTRHTPAVLAFGKAWSLDWSFPYLSLPLSLVAGLWLIKVLNITLGSLWTSISSVVIEAGIWVFETFDNFFGRSIFFHVGLMICLFYLLVMLVGGLVYGTYNAFSWATHIREDVLAVEK